MHPHLIIYLDITVLRDQLVVQWFTGIAFGKLKRCHSLKLLRSRDKEKLSRSNSFKSTGTSPGPNHDFKSDNENIDSNKKEKSPSMFSKWFPDWTDPDYVIFNSRATQTLERNEGEHRSKGRSSSLNRTSSKERHSHHLSSTPATPRPSHRNSSRQHTSDIYHYRSSSLSRKQSPSHKQESLLPPSPASKPSHQETPPKAVEEQVKIRPRYESPFSPFSARRKAQSLLMANEKYNNISNGSPSLFNGKVMPYQSTDIIKAYPMNNQSLSYSPQQKKTDMPIGIRRPTSLLSNLTAPKHCHQDSPDKDTLSSNSPRSTMTPDAKSEFSRNRQIRPPRSTFQRMTVDFHHLRPPPGQ
ncbi:storkhead-box protein 1 [Caerostris extrusa]|uniref:Storkhead-box protein 1 n=1 Tax=Caerostris extrusa TaxID=172846 RepID=A0AAV4UAV5_CAEEX|nr:storkhead-box protein 1 [Caerostris extrusa]